MKLADAIYNIADGKPFHKVYDCFFKLFDKKLEKSLKSLKKGRLFNILFILILYPIENIFRSLIKFIFKTLINTNIHIFQRPKLENKIVFSNFNGRGYGDHHKYICDEILRRNKNVKIVWLIKGKKVFDLDAFPEQVKLVKFGTLRAYYELITAKIFIKNIRCYSLLKKRKGQLIIQTWHGAVGIKKSGLDINVAQRSYFWYHKVYKECLINDYILSNSPYYSSILKTSYFFGKDFSTKILEIGHPRNDIFFASEETLNSLRSKFMHKYSISKETKLALYAPTYRGEHDVFQDTLDYASMRMVLHEKFGGSWLILVKYHPRCFKLIKKMFFPDYVINCSFHDDMQEILAVADIGITDYSSWIFDYMLSRKPAFIHAEDAAQYDNERGLYFPLESTPFPVSYTADELYENIQKFDHDVFNKKIDKFLVEKQVIDNGQASSKLYSYIEEYL